MVCTSHKLVNHINLGGTMAHSVLFYPKVGAKWWISYFLIFRLFKAHIDIFLWFPIEPIYRHCCMIPAKYHNLWFDICTVGTLFLNYTIFPRLPLHTMTKMRHTYFIGHIDVGCWKICHMFGFEFGWDLRLKCYCRSATDFVNFIFKSLPMWPLDICS